ncbi:MAG TPA: hypothetical protein VF669_04710 [Tepidisphaeraceae bacterium]
MTYHGTVQNGVVVLESRAKLPEGTAVRVERVQRTRKSSIGRKSLPKKKSLGQRLLKLAGTAPGLPSDMARNHDHYIRGGKKR